MPRAQPIKTDHRRRPYDSLWVKWGLVDIREVMEWNNPSWTPFIWVPLEVKERRG